MDASSVEHRIGADLAQGERLTSTLIDTTDRATRGIGCSEREGATWARRTRLVQGATQLVLGKRADELLQVNGRWKLSSPR